MVIAIANAITIAAIDGAVLAIMLFPKVSCPM
jgi:hypothetical protein